MKTALGYLFVLYTVGLLILVLIGSHLHLVEEPSEDDIAELPPSVELIKKLPDFAAITNIPDRKSAFFEYFRALIHIENGLILDQRKRLFSIIAERQRGNQPSQEDKLFIEKMVEYYSVDADTLDSQLETLTRRINIVPISMALAQAATESAWGTSRFARQAKNYFGQWCYKAGCGLIPRNRTPGATHEVAKFKTAQASVRSYFKNINSHAAYKKLRDMRHKMTETSQPIVGSKLIEGLGSYSQRGDAYIDELRSIINFNKLEEIH